jgi:hypothetical protein
MCANNLINAINYNAWKHSIACKRGRPQDYSYGRFTPKELKDINDLYHNRSLATQYLFKGHNKEIVPLGQLIQDETVDEIIVDIGGNENPFGKRMNLGI